MKLSEAVGKRVENLLAERNMTQYQLYKNGGIPRSTISVTVDGKYKTVKLDTIYQIVATLGITLKDFFDDALFDEHDVLAGHSARAGTFDFRAILRLSLRFLPRLFLRYI